MKKHLDKLHRRKTELNMRAVALLFFHIWINDFEAHIIFYDKQENMWDLTVKTYLDIFSFKSSIS